MGKKLHQSDYDKIKEQRDSARAKITEVLEQSRKATKSAEDFKQRWIELNKDYQKQIEENNTLKRQLDERKPDEQPTYPQRFNRTAVLNMLYNQATETATLDKLFSTDGIDANQRLETIKSTLEKDFGLDTSSLASIVDDSTIIELSKGLFYKRNEILAREVADIQNEIFDAEQVFAEFEKLYNGAENSRVKERLRVSLSEAYEALEKLRLPRIEKEAEYEQKLNDFKDSLAGEIKNAQKTLEELTVAQKTKETFDHYVFPILIEFYHNEKQTGFRVVLPSTKDSLNIGRYIASEIFDEKLTSLLKEGDLTEGHLDHKYLKCSFVSFFEKRSIEKLTEIRETVYKNVARLATNIKRFGPEIYALYSGFWPMEEPKQDGLVEQVNAENTCPSSVAQSYEFELVSLDLKKFINKRTEEFGVSVRTNVAMFIHTNPLFNRDALNEYVARCYGQKQRRKVLSTINNAIISLKKTGSIRDYESKQLEKERAY